MSGDGVLLGVLGTSGEEWVGVGCGISIWCRWRFLLYEEERIVDGGGEEVVGGGGRDDVGGSCASAWW